MKKVIITICCVFAVFTSACFVPAQEAPDSVAIRVITTFDYPGTGNLTRPQKINDRRDIVGQYLDSSGVTRGFVRLSNGSFSAPIVEPNDTGNSTQGRGINNSRLICGDYLKSDGSFHGYFLSGHRFSEFDIAGSVDTTVLGINNVGDFAGAFVDSAGTPLAFVSIGATITTFSVPGATFTSAYQLNSLNQLDGYYVDGSGVSHGYWRDTDGTLHFPIDPAGSTQTILFGNNDSNWMVGRYVDSAGTTHGLFFIPPSTFFTFDYPGSKFTSLSGINAQGFICGRYTDTAGVDHGILAQVRVSASANESGASSVTPNTPHPAGGEKMPAL